jgi:hypothetical protein
MDIFEQATRLKLRFDTARIGEITAEDLFDLPLTSKTGRANLDDIARSLHKQLKNGDDVSFVEPSRSSDPVIQLRFDIVKHVIGAKIEENQKAAKAREDAEKKQKIMALIADKKDEVLKGKPLEELEAMLTAL